AQFKYIRKETGAHELFDLLQDAGEQQNLAQSRPELVTRYQSLTARAFAQKKRYYQKHAGYELTRFNPASQDK
ncbi:MAG TPA: hypothetical protein PKY99_11235, partial [Turneriella sp.]|nr:hypothetical protein [Turneriella sp.]